MNEIPHIHAGQVDSYLACVKQFGHPSLELGIGNYLHFIIIRGSKSSVTQLHAGLGDTTPVDDCDFVDYTAQLQ